MGLGPIGYAWAQWCWLNGAQSISISLVGKVRYNEQLGIYSTPSSARSSYTAVVNAAGALSLLAIFPQRFAPLSNAHQDRVTG